MIFEWKSLFINGSLILANYTEDASYFQWDEKWVTKFNQAVRLSQRWQYQEAKTVLSPILNDVAIPKKAEVAELYGDLIYSTSGSLTDVITMYERSVGFQSNDRVIRKIEYIKQLQNKPKPSPDPDSNPEKTPTSTGSDEIKNKKEELEKISKQRSDYLSNTNASQAEIRSELQKLIEFAQSGTTQNAQDW